MILTGPEGKPLPLAYRWAVVNGLTSFTPWHVIDSEERVAFFRREFEAETGIDCWPFAQRQDMDDVAVFVVEDGAVQDRVIAVHLSYKGALDLHVRQHHFPDFWAWLSQMVLPEMATWATEADISEALADRAV